MRTAIVILNWNTEGYLKQFLPGLLASAPSGAEVIVADNGSCDGSVSMLERDFPAVRIIALEENYGFTGGYNKALSIVASLPEASDLEHFVLINSDIEVSEGWLEPLLQWMNSHPDCAVCGPKLRSWKEREFFEYAGAAGGFLDRFGYPFCRGRVLSRVEKDCGQYDAPSEVFWVSGACLVVRTSAYSQMGGLDDRFFAHMEEIDLCWRLHLEGFKAFVVPDSVVFHIGGGTLPNDSPWKLKLNFRNNLLMIDNNSAKTYALDFLSAGLPAEKAAAKGVLKAKMLILTRMVLDGCSALVWLLSGKTASFKAVLEAHSEFRRLRRQCGKEEVAVFLERHNGTAAPRLYPKWIIPLALLKGNGIFSHIRKTSGMDSTNV